MAGLEFYFDYRSPYAYLAHTQFAALNLQGEYRPFDIRSLMEKVGNVPTSVTCKSKNRYIQADLRRWVTRYGVPFERNPDIQEIDTNRLLRATLWADARGEALDALVATIFGVVWGGVRRPLRTAADLTELVAELGYAVRDFAEQVDSPGWHERLEIATAEAAERGVFGAPSFVVGDQLYFGNDRLEFVLSELQRA